MRHIPTLLFTTQEDIQKHPIIYVKVVAIYIIAESIHLIIKGDILFLLNFQEINIKLLGILLLNSLFLKNMAHLKAITGTILDGLQVDGTDIMPLVAGLLALVKLDKIHHL